MTYVQLLRNALANNEYIIVNIKMCHDKQLHEYIANLPSQNNTFYFIKIDESNILGIINDLKTVIDVVDIFF